MPLQRRGKGSGKHRHPVFHAFAIPHRDLTLGKINILDPQPHTLH
jgi:hypothetical protein